MCSECLSDAGESRPGSFPVLICTGWINAPFEFAENNITLWLAKDSGL